MREKLQAHLQKIYGSAAEQAFQVLMRALNRHTPANEQPQPWSQNDVVLITYGDQVDDGEHSPLEAQRRWILDHNVDQLVSTVHFLPFFPYSSDDGFSVIDYRAILPEWGDWDDVERYRDKVHLMFDLVLNHASQHSQWFKDFLRDEPPYNEFFVTVEDGVDVSSVTRPRSLPLLTQFETTAGPRNVWTTFSADQVDLNFANPEVLAEFMDILLMFAQRGAKIIRLDAIAYLWKELGTPCIHLPETHEVVKLMRTVLENYAPATLLLTETNVPHDENVSYFGDGDEAHMVYQFSLPPLLLDAILGEDATRLRNWLAQLAPPSPGTTYFNFTASHDGIGVRPLEGLVDSDRLTELVEQVRQRGGRVSMRRHPDGTESPYELNIAYVDAVSDQNASSPVDQAKPFLTTQAIMLALQGMPALYFHSLVGSRNDYEGLEQSGQARRINRRKFQRDDLEHQLSDDQGIGRIVFEQYGHLLRTRRAQAAFHPDAAQQVVDIAASEVLALARQPQAGNPILMLANVSSRTVPVEAAQLQPYESLQYDLISEQSVATDQGLSLAPYQVMWLSSQPSS